MNLRGIGVLLLICLISSLLLFFASPEVPGRADLVIGNGTDPGSLHPHRATGIPEGRIIRSIHEGVLLLHPETLEPIPGCAESWEISDDGTQYRFQIQQGLKWSDGSPLDAQDFRRSWLDLLDPLQGAPYGDLLDSVVGAKAWRSGQGIREDVQIRTSGQHILEINFEHPLPWFPYLCAQTPLQPVHSSSKGRAGSDIPTNGPWIMTMWNLRDRIRIEPNPHYHGPAKPSLQTIDFLAVESGNTQLNLFAAGMSDWTVRVPTPAIPVLQTDSDWSSMWHADPYLGISFYRLNLNKPPLDDPAVRKALSLSIDRHELCQEVLGGDPEPAYGFVPWPSPAIERQKEKLSKRGIDRPLIPVLPEYEGMALIHQDNGFETVTISSIKAADWPTLCFNPEKARQLLRQSGWQTPGFPEGRTIPPLEILHPSGAQNSLVAEWLQLCWKKELGLDTHIRSMEWRSFLDVQRSVDYDISRSTWIADYPDPATFLTLFTSDAPNSRTNWSDREYDLLVKKALAESGIEKRMDLWRQAEGILLERGPILPLWSMTSENLVSHRVTGFWPNPLDQHDLRNVSRRSP